MKDFILKLISEEGDTSTMRFMAIISLIIGGIISFIGVYKCTDLTGISLLTSVFVGAAFTGKVMQRSIEQQTVNNDENNKDKNEQQDKPT